MTWQSVCRPVGDEWTSDPRSSTSSHSRREFLANLAALGSTAVTPARRLIAQTAEVGAKPGMIDFHHHIVPLFYLPENRDRIVAAGGGRINPAYLNWTPTEQIRTKPSRISDDRTSMSGINPSGTSLRVRVIVPATPTSVSDLAPPY